MKTTVFQNHFLLSLLWNYFNQDFTNKFLIKQLIRMRLSIYTRTKEKGSFKETM